MTSKPNDELRHEWRLWLKQVRGRKLRMISAKLAALSRYEKFNGNRPFIKLRREYAAAFKEHLLSMVSDRTDEKLSASTVVHTLEHCQDFFKWLAITPDGRKLDKTAIDWFNPSKAEKERARAVEPKPVSLRDDAIAAFEAMPTETL